MLKEIKQDLESTDPLCRKEALVKLVKAHDIKENIKRLKLMELMKSDQDPVIREEAAKFYNMMFGHDGKAEIIVLDPDEMASETPSLPALDEAQVPPPEHTEIAGKESEEEWELIESPDSQDILDQSDLEDDGGLTEVEEIDEEIKPGTLNLDEDVSNVEHSCEAIEGDSVEQVVDEMTGATAEIRHSDDPETEIIESPGSEQAAEIIETVDQQSEALIEAMNVQPVEFGKIDQDTARIGEFSEERQTEIFKSGSVLEKTDMLRAIEDGKITVEPGWLSGLLSLEEDISVLEQLLSCIGRNGRTEDAEKILSFLSHNDPRIRAKAIETLGKLKNEKSYNYIVIRYMDEDRGVKARAEAFLLSLGRKNLMEILGKMLSSSRKFNIIASTFLLSRMDTPEAKFMLLGAMKKRKSEKKNKSQS
ncbi:MAG: HEAT repeat domain-containing protein [Candidatus Wallbacteria bacterium]|nr:HEAT repeat domain-containing protein [Candidatus Wallbacteria bacterium]